MKEAFVMKIFYSIKNHFGSFRCCIREWLYAVVCEATMDLAPMVALYILGKEYIIGSDLSSSLMFRSNFCLNDFLDGMRSF